MLDAVCSEDESIMSAQVLVWLKFTACVLIIFFAGTRLARYGDVIAERTGLGRFWIGLMLIAIITSTPEVVASVSSVTLVNLPDLSVGNILGSCMFNLTLISLADALYRAAPVLSQVSPTHIMSAGFSILLIASAAVGILTRGFAGLEVAQVGIPSIIIVVVYVASAWWIFCHERRHKHEENVIAYPEYEKLPSRTVYLRFTIAAAIIVGAAIWLSLVGDEIVRVHRMDASFVGSTFVAVTTSMPELMVTIAAVRIGALDMAIANVLGSNMFDVAIITMADGAYRDGPIFLTLSRAHLITILVTIAMTLVVIGGIRFPTKHKTFRLVSWHSLVLLGLYVFGTYSIFHRLFFA
jgi:cation:H+ antiporter